MTRREHNSWIHIKPNITKIPSIKNSGEGLCSFYVCLCKGEWLIILFIKHSWICLKHHLQTKSLSQSTDGGFIFKIKRAAILQLLCLVFCLFSFFLLWHLTPTEHHIVVLFFYKDTWGCRFEPKLHQEGHPGLVWEFAHCGDPYRREQLKGLTS